MTQLDHILAEESRASNRAYILVENHDIAISSNPIKTKTQGDLIWMRLDGLFPNYGSAVAIANQMRLMFQQFGIEVIFSDLTETKETLVDNS